MVLCTGNVCRSPVAHRLLADRTARAGLDVRVSSAGFWRAGQPASASSVSLLAERGIDASAHRSTLVTPELLGEADLIVGMAREHVREAVVTSRQVWIRAYTLKELVRRGMMAGPRLPGQDLDSWLATIHNGRTPAGLMGSDPADDVADPIGQPMGVYQRMVAELEGLVDAMVGLIWSPAFRATGQPRVSHAAEGSARSGIEPGQRAGGVQMPAAVR
ncbi:MAG: arsenate reductase/protein-tyrosine-phosphatase family protein [Acidimicrobiales bacterium]